MEFRIRVVKLFLEEGYSISMLAEEFACGKSTISKWIKVYREQGESGLDRPSTRLNKARKTLDPNLESKITELKKDDSQRGVRRISDIMRRFTAARPLLTFWRFFVGVSLNTEFLKKC